MVYIIAWRGLAALLILGEGQCEGLKSGMGEIVRFSHAFFVSVGAGPVPARTVGAGPVPARMTSRRKEICRPRIAVFLPVAAVQ